jgi:hypothetical protein
MACKKFILVSTTDRKYVGVVFPDHPINRIYGNLLVYQYARNVGEFESDEILVL